MSGTSAAHCSRGCWMPLQHSSRPGYRLQQQPAEEPCDERQPSNPIYRCSQCGALFGALLGTELSTSQTRAKLYSNFLCCG